jgi:hypothetical protein
VSELEQLWLSHVLQVHLSRPATINPKSAPSAPDKGSIPISAVVDGNKDPAVVTVDLSLPQRDMQGIEQLNIQMYHLQPVPTSLRPEGLVV